MESLTAGETWARFAAAAGITTAVCLAVGYVLLKFTGVPATYPPLRPLQIISGTLGGAFLTALGYSLLAALIRDQRTLVIVFFVAGVVLLLASFHLPYRLSYTKSPRFGAEAKVGIDQFTHRPEDAAGDVPGVKARACFPGHDNPECVLAGG